MRPRIVLAKSLIRLGHFISSLPVMVMRPDDLVEFGRQNYARPEGIQYWGNDDYVSLGLTAVEKTLLKKTNLTQGNVLVLCLGGGREAIPLAKMGFSVTGVDYIPELVKIAQENAAKQGVLLNAQVGEFIHFVPPPSTFNLIWLSDRMYSSVATRRKRIEVLNRMHTSLVPGGWFICGFCWLPSNEFSPRVERMRKLVAYLSRGNLCYEAGDKLFGQFIHTYGDKSELASEFTAGGFTLTALHLPQDPGDTTGAALLHKAV